MTSLQSTPRAHDRTSVRSEAEVRHTLATRRPFALTAASGGAVAAAAPLLVCLAVAVVGWFLTDAGGHGSPSGALRVGALGWLVAHGSGVVIEGARVSAVPLGITLLCAWSVWRVGHRVGESVSGHGPDADRIADGERDWTVPVATGLFAAGYVVVAAVTASLAATVETAPSLPAVTGWSLLLAGGVGLPAIARGSGRAAIWVQSLPVAVRDSAVLCRTLLLGWLAVATAAVVVALVLDFSTAANIVSQLGTDTGGTVQLALLSLVLLPNAVLFGSAYLLGPGFAVGTGTLVSPSAVVLGPLPLLPLLAALPSEGQPAAWVAWLMVSPLVVAFLASAWCHHRRPAATWDRAAIRGCAGGLTAGVLLSLMTVVAGGAVGPGRMADVGPSAFDVLLHSVTAFGIGGLLGALAMTWWQRSGAALAGRGRARLRRR